MTKHDVGKKPLLIFFLPSLKVFRLHKSVLLRCENFGDELIFRCHDSLGWIVSSSLCYTIGKEKKKKYLVINLWEFVEFICFRFNLFQQLLICGKSLDAQIYWVKCKYRQSTMKWKLQVICWRRCYLPFIHTYKDTNLAMSRNKRYHLLARSE